MKLKKSQLKELIRRAIVEDIMDKEIKNPKTGNILNIFYDDCPQDPRDLGYTDCNVSKLILNSSRNETDYVFEDSGFVSVQNSTKTRKEHTATFRPGAQGVRNMVIVSMKSWQVMGEVLCWEIAFRCLEVVLAK